MDGLALPARRRRVAVLAVAIHAHEDPTARTLRMVRDEWTRPWRNAVADVAVTPCREWCENKNDRCGQVAEFILWGKLFDPDALGPRCYDHAAKWAGHGALGDPAWAIVDLRPMLRLLSGTSDEGGAA